MSDLTERLRSWAQNEEMIDSDFLAHGRDCNLAADQLLAAQAELAEAKRAAMSDNYDGPALAQKIIRQQKEIERLRAELHELRAAKIANEVLYRETKRMAKLEAELAEAVKVLRASVDGWSRWPDEDLDPTGEVVRVRAFLAKHKE